MRTDVHERHEWLSAQEVARELRVDVSAIYRAVRAGRIRALRLSPSGPLRINRSVLDQREEQP
jgi:excisionase family DNA binding protein